MKKFLMFLFGGIIVFITILFLAKNFIVREILVRKLTTANNAPVSIGEVDISLRKGYIILKDIEINSNLNKEKVFIKMDELKSYYEVENLRKKIIFNDTEIKGFLLFDENTIKNYKNHENIELFEEKISKTEEKSKKDKVVMELKKIYLNRVGLDKETISKKLKEKYNKYKEIEKDLNNFNSSTLDELKGSIEKIEDSKKMDMVSTFFSEIKKIEKSAKKFLKGEKGKKAQNKIKNFFSKDSDLKMILDDTIEEILDRNDFIVKDLDSYINIYLNTIYEEKIFNIFKKYNMVVEEINKRKDVDKEIKDGDIWELYFKSISINSNMYGINFYGELKNVSSRISKNKKNIPFKLFGEKGETIGKIEGFINLDTGLLLATTHIPEANLTDVNSNIFQEGKVMLSQNLLVNSEKLSIDGFLELGNMKLNSQKIISDMAIKENLVDELLEMILQELNFKNIEYNYDTKTRNLEIKSDISNILKNIMSDRNSLFKINIKEKIKKEYLEKIDD